MIRFLLKGILRDRSRSLFPFLVVTAGVFLTVVVHCYIKGAETSVIRLNASLLSGHVKVMTRGYAKEADQVPNDLGLSGVNSLLQGLEKRFPNYFWTPRIRFGGLLDIPDENGETRSQGPVVGTAVDMLSAESPEIKLLDLKNALVRGRLPERSKEMLISDEFAQKLGVNPGERATLISSTMFGSMSLANLIVAGTIRFGASAMDRTAIVADLSDIQSALDMKECAGEILGFSRDGVYRQEEADRMVAAFSPRQAASPDADDLTPVMLTLRDQPGMGAMINRLAYATGLIVGVFVVALSLVLWNAGLLGSLRRYGEIGVRLAMGENKGHLYRSLLAESLIIGFLGTVAGTFLGLALSYYLQVKGINISSMVRNAAMMIPSVLYSQITPFSYVIGFFPGLLASLLGTAISGVGIFRRQTAQLFKELEA
jgi:putative ABC transport system permease protein